MLSSTFDLMAKENLGNSSLSSLSPWSPYNISVSSLVSRFEKVAEEQIKAKPELRACIGPRASFLRVFNQKVQSLLNYIDWSKKSGPWSIAHQVHEHRSIIFLASKLRAFNWSLYNTQFFPQLSDDEWTYPQHCPLIEIDRMSAKRSQNMDDVESTSDLQQLKQSMFGQMYNALTNTEERRLRQSTVYVMDAGQKRAFRVNFRGEGVDDYGGPYSQLFVDCCCELQSPLLSLFIPTPNNKAEQGKNQGQYMVNPSFTLDLETTGNVSQDLYRFIGQMIGMALRSSLPLPLNLAPTFWKPLVGERISRHDLEPVDVGTAKLLAELLTISEHDFESKYSGEGKQLSFTVFAHKKERDELIPNGKNIHVTWDNRKDYVSLVLSYKQAEGQLQLSAIKEGLSGIIPHDMLMLFTWQELELTVCGSPIIDVRLLRDNTVYEGVNPNEEFIDFFWQVLEEFDNDQRSKFLQFVWARTRLPALGLSMNFKIQKSLKEPADKYMPTTQTCFFSISLPQYSSLDIMRNHLTYATTHCVAMDNDYLH